VDVSSAPGRGTRFRVFLPLQQAAVLPGRRERQPAVAGSGGHEVVLVVEDEDQLRKLVVTALERSGYTVLQAGAPDEALEIVRERQGGIDVLLTDVIMPGMDGAELQRRMLRIRPGMRTLFMSGYTANIIGEHGILDGGIYFIQKPFSVRDLMKKIRELLD
jgi:two-component system, cell cycle sensor histidine kinase and response regulator CckA